MCLVNEDLSWPYDRRCTTTYPRSDLFRGERCPSSMQNSRWIALKAQSPVEHTIFTPYVRLRLRVYRFPPSWSSENRTYLWRMRADPSASSFDGVQARR